MPNMEAHAASSPESLSVGKPADPEPEAIGSSPAPAPTGGKQDGIRVEFEDEQAVLVRWKAEDLGLVDEARGVVIRGNGSSVPLSAAMKGRLGRVATRGQPARLVVLAAGLAAEIAGAARGHPNAIVVVGARAVSTR